MNEAYAIVDLEKYSIELRACAAEHISPNNNEDLDSYITIQQVYSIVEENSIGMDNEGRYLLDEDANNSVFDDISIRIYNVGIAKLAAAGKIECAWDSEENEMVFWQKSKDDGENNE
jgi:hypothetical protein